MDITYEVYNDEQQIIDKINSLEPMFQRMSSENNTQVVCYEDLYFLSAIDKSLKLIEVFLFALEKRNITVLAILTRVQLDCLLRTYASTLVDDSSDFCKNVLSGKIQINRTKCSTGDKMTDKFLCESIEATLNLPIYELYEKVCGYVHFSASSFHNAIHMDGENSFVMKVSQNNQEEYLEVYNTLSIELANHFYYFGKLLIDVVLKSWWEQKKELYKASE